VAAGRKHAVVLTNDGRVRWHGLHKSSEWNAGGGDNAAPAVAIGAGDNFGVFLTSKGDAMLMLREYGESLPCMQCSTN
jgi:hypothetical protein